MSNGAKVAMAVGAGYMLGRTKRMRLALMLAAAGVTGKFPTRPTELVAHGLKSLGASADVSQLTEQLRGELLNAGRAAALSAATNQINSFNDRLQGVTSAVDVDESLDDVGDTLDNVGDAVGGVGGAIGVGEKRRRRRSQDDDYVEEDDAYDERDDEDDEDDDLEPLDVDEIDEDEDEDVDEDLEDDDEEPDEEPEQEPEPPVTRRRAAKRSTSTPKKSVRATKRTAARATSGRGR